MMVEDLKQVGTWHVSSEVLKMSVNCDGNLDIQEAGNTKVICVYLIGAFCRKDLHRESQGTQSEDGEQSNIRILYRRTEGCPSEPVQTGSVGLG